MSSTDSVRTLKACKLLLHYIFQIDHHNSHSDGHDDHDDHDHHNGHSDGHDDHDNHDEDHDEDHDENHNSTNCSSCDTIYKLCRTVILSLNLTTTDCLEEHNHHSNTTESSHPSSAQGMNNFASVLPILFLKFMVMGSL